MPRAAPLACFSACVGALGCRSTLSRQDGRGAPLCTRSADAAGEAAVGVPTSSAAQAAFTTKPGWAQCRPRVGRRPRAPCCGEARRQARPLQDAGAACTSGWGASQRHAGQHGLLPAGTGASSRACACRAGVGGGPQAAEAPMARDTGVSRGGRRSSLGHLRKPVEGGRGSYTTGAWVMSRRRRSCLSTDGSRALRTEGPSAAAVGAT